MKKRTLALKLVAGALIFSLSITAISPLGNTGTVQVNAGTSYSPESDFTFDASSGCITAYQGSDQNVTIPNTIDGTSVKGIEWGAFSGNTDLTQITLPETVVSIGSMAFEGCNGLTGIKIPAGVTEIAPYTFYGCSSLATVELPDTVTRIMLEAFKGCTSLQSITIPSSVTSIEDDVFSGISSLTIIGAKGSYAETYASAAGVPFTEAADPDDNDNTQPGQTTPTDPSSPTDSTTPTDTTTPTKPTVSTKLKLNKSKYTLYTRGKRTFTLTVSANGRKLRGTAVTWSSSNKKVATVSKTGKITARKKGKTTISATYRGVTVKSKITVKNPVLKLKKTKAVLKVKKKVKIRATATPATKITYRSSNKRVATVTKKGVVTARKAGKTKITVTANGVKKRFTVIVKK